MSDVRYQRSDVSGGNKGTKSHRLTEEVEIIGGCVALRVQGLKRVLLHMIAFDMAYFFFYPRTYQLRSVDAGAFTFSIDDSDVCRVQS